MNKEELKSQGYDLIIEISKKQQEIQEIQMKLNELAKKIQNDTK